MTHILEEPEALPPVVLTVDILRVIQQAEQHRIAAERFVTVGGGTAEDLARTLRNAAECYSEAAKLVADEG